MKQEKYDIFISYRRTAYDTANLIAEKLRNAGYKVFFDVDTLTSGKFNEQLLQVIADCKDFVLVLPEGALDRCVDENDWIRREIICAFEHRKNIIPVMLDGFAWSADLPDCLKELPNYQAITAVGYEYFDMAMKRLQTYLKSSPSVPIKAWLTKASIVLLIIAIILGIGYKLMTHVSNVACEHIGTQMAAGMNVMDLLAEQRKDLKKYYTDFTTAFGKYVDVEERKKLENDLIVCINRIEKEKESIYKTLSPPSFELNSIERYVLALHGITEEELKAFSAYYEVQFDDMNEIVSSLREQLEAHDYSLDRYLRTVSDFDCADYSNNAFYYGYMGMVSLLPKDARKTHHEMAKKWRNFPNGTALDLTQEEYEQFQMHEMNKIEEEYDRFSAEVNFNNRELSEMEERLEKLEKETKSFSE